MRLNEICSLYLDKIIQKSGNHREKRWCFNISEEKHRPDKKLKTQSSRRIIPIHDTLIDLGLVEHVIVSPDREYYYLFGSLWTTSASIDWIKNIVAGKEDFSEIIKQAI